MHVEFWKQYIYIYINSMLVWGCFGCNKRPTSKRKRASFYNVNCICFVCFSDGLVLDNFLPKIRKSTSESRANQKKSHIAVEIYWRKNGETKGDTKATGPIGNENTKLLVVIVQKVIDPLNVIFETSFRKDEPGQDEQNLKQNSYSDAQWMKWHNDQKVLGIHLFVLFSSVTSYFAFQFFAFLQALWKKKHKWNDFEWTKHMVPGFCKNTD